MNYELLQERLNDAATTDEQFLADYNAETIEINAPVLIADLAQYVDPEILPRLLAAKDNPGVTGGVRVCVNAALELRKAPYKDFSVRSLSFVQSMAVLQNAGILTSAHVDGLLALGTRYTSQSMIDHGQATSQQDINIMRAQDGIAALQDIENRLVAAFNAALLNTQTARFTLESGEDATVYTSEQVKAGFIMVFDNGETA